MRTQNTTQRTFDFREFPAFANLFLGSEGLLIPPEDGLGTKCLAQVRLGTQMGWDEWDPSHFPHFHPASPIFNPSRCPRRGRRKRRGKTYFLVVWCPLGSQSYRCGMAAWLTPESPQSFCMGCMARGGLRVLEMLL